jgi:hypothetical protein
LFRSERRRTPDISCSTYDENRLARFDSRSGNKLVASRRNQRQGCRQIKSSPLGIFAKIAAFSTQSSA